MPELYREPTEEDLRFARKPLDEIDPKRVAAYRTRYRGIEKLFDAEIRKTFLATKTDRDRYSTAESRALEAEKDRKLGQLEEEFKGMLDPGMFAAAKRVWDEFAATSPYKAGSYLTEAGSYAQTGLTIAGGSVAMGLQLGATGLLLSNPFTASLALLNELDKWIGRAIGWVQMARKQWDADCSRISMRVASAIAKAKSDSSLDTARNGGMFSAGAKDSTLTRQRLEKLLYHKIFKIREEAIKYKIRECEVTAEAQRLLEQKRPIEAQVHAIEQQLAAYDRDIANLPSKAHLVLAGRKVDVKQHHAALKKKAAQLRAECLKLSEKIMDLLNEVVDNANRLINQTQVDVERLVNEVVQSFQITEIKGKFAGTHTQGAWRGAIRRAF